MIFKIIGQIVEKESGQGLPGLTVKAYDKDWIYDDLLGSVETDREGKFEMVYEGRDFQELFERNPDIYLRVKNAALQDIYSTEDSVRFEAKRTESFKIEIPKDALVDPEESREIAVELYKTWVEKRQERPAELRIPETLKELEPARKENLLNQLIKPRQKHLEQLKKAAPQMSTADKVALLVSLELPALEISTLLQRLSRQLRENPQATYFNQVNQRDNCGCGCGCGCAVLADFPYEERIRVHRETKPFSIDPFNEINLSTRDRDSLLTRDFLRSYEALSTTVSENVQKPSYNTAREVVS